MRHDWIIEVLTDLRAYAQKNDLPRIAEGVEALLDVAATEVATGDTEDEGDDSAGRGGTPPRGLPH